MKTLNFSLVLLIFLCANSFSQIIYEVTPGTKGNEIILTVANVSEENPVTEIIIKSPAKPPLREGLEEEVITFHQSEKTIDILNAKAEKDVSFTFDINRNAPINRKDTIEFMITDANGLMMMKSFIFSYTGPKEFKLEQNFPNPFNPTTTIQYQLPHDARVTLKVYDILGSEVATLVNEGQEAGYKEVQFSGSNIASGMYVYRLSADKFVSVKKMMVLK
ncbi:MAG: T9SS type A sorting domain-containing protein [Ignavibacteriaceae bacterium]|nr:T9SS type A sorting domain-containing protein [Ignavibacteriaceae bacterium]